MTEAEWMSADLATRYSYLLPRRNGGELSLLPRRGRLLWVAWAREVYQELPWVYRLQADYAERLADDPALTDTGLRSVLVGGLEGIGHFDPRPKRAEALRRLERRLREEFELRPCGDEPPDYVGRSHGAQTVRGHLALSHNTPACDLVPESGPFASFFRDIFGNPFRPPAFDAVWRSETATALAAGIYEERAFDRMPVLADALEEAGCDNAEILTHCRGDGPHARGCWVVDLLLGKS